MKDTFLSYIEEHQLFNSSDRILLGISGGRDSLTMLYLLHDLGYDIAIAHCNFQLRAKESDEDELFVQEIAENLQIPFYHTRFETKKWAKKNKVSTQMAARTLRYNWFDEIRKEYQYNYIGIAHNSNDVIETFFINLTRGTGIDGLTGIKPKNNYIVRPLLFASREQINQYIKKNKWTFREDSSNASTHYLRNKIRHKILPEFEETTALFHNIMLQNIENLQQVAQLYHQHIQKEQKQILIPFTNHWEIDINRLKKQDFLFTYLYEILKPFQFNASTIKEIIKSIDNSSGKQFLSASHLLIKDREKLIITTITEENNEPLFFDEHLSEITFPIHLKITKVLRKNYTITAKKNITVLDYDKLTFPLQLRKWQQGDYFMPLGMNRMKKLSNFFIDKKYSLIDKKNAYLIQSRNDIACIINERIDERYKVTEDSHQLLIITYSNN